MVTSPTSAHLPPPGNTGIVFAFPSGVFSVSMKRTPWAMLSLKLTNPSLFVSALTNSSRTFCLVIK